MATTYSNNGPIWTTSAKYEAMRVAGTLEVGREYRISDWVAQGELTAGNGIKIEDGVISINSSAGIAIYDTRIADANSWLTNGYVKTRNVSEEYATATANLPSVCTGNDRWGVLLYVAENNSNYAGLQQYFPIDGTYKGRVFYRSVTGLSAGMTPVFGTWNMVPWQSETISSVSDLADKLEGSMLLATDVNAGGTKVDTHFDLTGASAGKVPVVNSSNTGMVWGNVDRIDYTTTAPTAANTDGLKIAVLSATPATKYDGWLYIITGT